MASKNPQVIIVGGGMITRLQLLPAIYHLQRALSLSDKLCFMLTADDIHLPYFVLNDILRIAGFDRCVIVSDAMAATVLKVS